jgi:hypothetical protein
LVGLLGKKCRFDVEFGRIASQGVAVLFKRRKERAFQTYFNDFICFLLQDYSAYGLLIQEVFRE